MRLNTHSYTKLYQIVSLWGQQQEANEKSRVGSTRLYLRVRTRSSQAELEGLVGYLLLSTLVGQGIQRSYRKLGSRHWSFGSDLRHVKALVVLRVLGQLRRDR